MAASDDYAASQRVRKRIEEVFAWVKTVAGWRKTQHRGLARVGWQFTLALGRLPLAASTTPPEFPGRWRRRLWDRDYLDLVLRGDGRARSRCRPGEYATNGFPPGPA